MKKITLLLFCLLTIVLFSSHDMFLKLNNFFLEPNSTSAIQLFNGTLEKSDNVIDRGRMIDASIVSNGVREAADSSDWFEKDSITYLKFKTGISGTYVTGVSTAPRNIEMSAEKFNKYLKNDGVQSMLDKRKANKTLNSDAVEKYSKHVKTIFQVGETTSTDWNVNLGYPIEFIPLENPYEAHTGHLLPVKLLLRGKPLANHPVFKGHQPNEVNNNDHQHQHNGQVHNHEHEQDGKMHAHEHTDEGEHKHSHNANEHSHKHDDEKHTHEHIDIDEHNHSQDEASDHHNHKSVAQLITDTNGVINLDITGEGIWYLRTIHMVESADKLLTHESNWATLTFAIGSALNHSHDIKISDHDHEHDHEEGFPSSIFWIASIVLVGILYFWFNSKK
jgi:uncharacterized GH25 family protein